MQCSLVLSIPRNKKVLRGRNSTTSKRSKIELVTQIAKYRFTMTGEVLKIIIFRPLIKHNYTLIIITARPLIKLDLNDFIH